MNGTSTVHYNTSELLNSTGLTPVAVNPSGGVTQQLPQSIQFYDQTVAEITVGHNGLIALGGPLPAGEVPGSFHSVLSGASAEPPVLALFWPGISTACGGSVYMGSTESGVYTVVYDGESHAVNGFCQRLLQCERLMWCAQVHSTHLCCSVPCSVVLCMLRRQCAAETQPCCVATRHCAYRAVLQLSLV
jgi:hypothetical protein